MEPDKLRLLDPPPDFQPDAARAWERLQPRLRQKPANPWQRWAIAATVLIAATLAVPAAQYLLRWMTLSRVEIVRLDIDSVMNDLKFMHGTSLTQNGPVKLAKDLAEAETRLGYKLHLPRPGTFAQPPKFATWSGLTSRAIMDSAELQSVLTRKGVTDETVPAAWHGKAIVVHVGPVSFAEWPGEYSLIETNPIQISAAPELDLAHMVRLILRATGANKEQANRLALTFKDNPMWLWGISPDEPVEIRQVRLRHGPATLVTDLSDNNEPDRSVLLWHTPDRVFALNGPPGEQFLIAAANAIEP